MEHLGLYLDHVSVGGLSAVSLTVPPGAVVCLSGPSGSGKSRLLRAVADLEPHGGQVHLGDEAQASCPAHQWRQRVMLVPADSQWWFEAVAAHFPDRARGPVPSALGLPPEVMAWPISRLSSGERQRLALYRALVREPRALLLDEPTANLDGDSTRAVEQWLLAEIRRRSLAVLWVAHDPEQIRRVADAHYRIRGAELERADDRD
ncbi:ATP-binding cassette domain-containing protein [Marinobacter lutaoensis]|jgi:ABC-type iron transport system FetAB ATPase subunit|uniref:ABC transporter ATP-binding protein n=1 Tax=Marinobacter lutaoensis TaxID=135739 RepID=UPI000C423A7A|nr:ATP-binding cassette domain-containing protein [Marinobacter lutaoensis]MBI42940.1 ABC transporter [Oceanospirillales bacterium]NVD34550.1 ATP-binding cassette domain-containing protein [Marinobacter lutaoensis]|tara:strand:+ start:71 stop:685 length:615 start_codon:yes stop_codon:yes gene_type:complete